mgnify:CR=1 FL=1
MSVHAGDSVGERATVPLLAVTMTALAPILWSTGGLGFRLVDATPWTMLFWRSLFMALTLLGASRFVMGRRFLKDFRTVAANGLSVGIFIALALIFYVLSITATTVADSLLVQAAGPLFIVVFGWILLREEVRVVTVVALLVVGAGIAFILVPSLERGGFSGNIMGLLKALAFAAATVLIRRKRGVQLLPAVSLGAIIATIVSAVAAPTLSVDTRSLLILAYLGVFQTGIAFALHATFSGRLPSSQTGLLVLLEAILGPIWVWVFLAEAPAALTLIGGTMILSALIAHTLIYARPAARTS